MTLIAKICEPTPGANAAVGSPAGNDPQGESAGHSILAAADAPDPERRAALAPRRREAGGAAALPQGDRPREIGGRQGPDPIRFGDWELRGRCIDF